MIETRTIISSHMRPMFLNSIFVGIHLLRYLLSHFIGISFYLRLLLSGCYFCYCYYRCCFVYSLSSSRFTMRNTRAYVCLHENNACESAFAPQLCGSFSAYLKIAVNTRRTLSRICDLQLATTFGTKGKVFITRIIILLNFIRNYQVFFQIFFKLI